MGVPLLSLELYSIAQQIKLDRIGSVVIDSCSGVESHNLQSLAKKLDGSYQQIRDLNAGRLIEAVWAAEEK